jgi:hypothetical protein
MMAYVNYYYNCYWRLDSYTCTRYMLVTTNKSNGKWTYEKIQERGAILYYAMLYYVQMKLKGLLLVLTSNVSGYTIIIELSLAHLIYVMVCFGNG